MKHILLLFGVFMLCIMTFNSNALEIQRTWSTTLKVQPLSEDNETLNYLNVHRAITNAEKEVQASLYAATGANNLADKSVKEDVKTAESVISEVHTYTNIHTETDLYVKKAKESAENAVKEAKISKESADRALCIAREAEKNITYTKNVFEHANKTIGKHAQMKQIAEQTETDANNTLLEAKKASINTNISFVALQRTKNALTDAQIALEQVKTMVSLHKVTKRHNIIKDLYSELEKQQRNTDNVVTSNEEILKKFKINSYSECQSKIHGAKSYQNTVNYEFLRVQKALEKLLEEQQKLHGAVEAVKQKIDLTEAKNEAQSAELFARNALKEYNDAFEFVNKAKVASQNVNIVINECLTSLLSIQESELSQNMSRYTEEAEMLEKTLSDHIKEMNDLKAHFPKDQLEKLSKKIQTAEMLLEETKFNFKSKTQEGKKVKEEQEKETEKSDHTVVITQTITDTEKNIQRINENFKKYNTEKENTLEYLTKMKTQAEKVSQLLYQCKIIVYFTNTTQHYEKAKQYHKDALKLMPLIDTIVNETEQMVNLCTEVKNNMTKQYTNVKFSQQTTYSHILNAEKAYKEAERKRNEAVAVIVTMNAEKSLSDLKNMLINIEKYEKDALMQGQIAHDALKSVESEKALAQKAQQASKAMISACKANEEYKKAHNFYYEAKEMSEKIIEVMNVITAVYKNNSTRFIPQIQNYYLSAIDTEKNASMEIKKAEIAQNMAMKFKTEAYNAFVESTNALNVVQSEDAATKANNSALHTQNEAHNANLALLNVKRATQKLKKTKYAMSTIVVHFIVNTKYFDAKNLLESMEKQKTTVSEALNKLNTMYDYAEGNVREEINVFVEIVNYTSHCASKDVQVMKVELPKIEEIKKQSEKALQIVTETDKVTDARIAESDAQIAATNAEKVMQRINKSLSCTIKDVINAQDAQKQVEKIITKIRENNETHAEMVSTKNDKDISTEEKTLKEKKIIKKIKIDPFFGSTSTKKKENQTEKKVTKYIITPLSDLSFYNLFTCRISVILILLLIVIAF